MMNVESLPPPLVRTPSQPLEVIIGEPPLIEHWLYDEEGSPHVPGMLERFLSKRPTAEEIVARGIMSPADLPDDEMAGHLHVPNKLARFMARRPSKVHIATSPLPPLLYAPPLFFLLSSTLHLVLASSLTSPPSSPCQGGRRGEGHRQVTREGGGRSADALLDQGRTRSGRWEAAIPRLARREGHSTLILLYSTPGDPHASRVERDWQTATRRS